MARTVHHIVWQHMTANDHSRHTGMPCEGTGWRRNCSYRGPLNTLSDLRYSAADLTAAARDGHRPSPARVTRTVQHTSYVALWTDNIGEYCNAEERAARTRTRDRLRHALGHANAALSDGDWDAFDDEAFDVPPTRHRGSARWIAW